MIQTGDAYTIGNESSTTLNQRADAQAHGTLGGVLVLSQDALVVNAGLGVSNTGLNVAVGNAAGALAPGNGNNAGVLQNAENTSGGLGGATNSGSASNDSNGKATISTGNASATGNKSWTTVNQVAGSGDGDGDAGGLTVLTQLGGALNAGAALANTGVNGAVGNASLNAASVGDPNNLALPQNTEVDVDGIGFANNSASATNASDGTAWITTGDANAIGNDSRTNVMQDAHAEFGDQGVNIQTQLAPVINVGLGVANTGVNGAVGNLSQNSAAVAQDALGADGTGPALAAIVNNSGEAANSSNGTAEIHTGDAWARGNWSTTDVSQWTEADGTALAVQTQVGLVANVGVGVANTGVNGAIGNASQNNAGLAQTAILDLGTATLGLGIVNNSGAASNDSDGSASIITGDAYASGNESTTRVRQAIDPTGVAVQTQLGMVANIGIAASNSGVNGAVGNISDNASGDNGAFLTQNATVDPNSLLAGVSTASNQGEASNGSDGTASISTGAASSLGNHSDTGLTQESNASVDGLGVAVNTQLGVVANVGVGVANSGVNGAVGNISANRAETTQTNNIDGASVQTGVLSASNSGRASNDTDGTGIITTGDAQAKGNVSVTDVSQKATAAVPGTGIAVNTQAGLVLNAGVAIANSGGNVAVGNLSDSEAFLTQDADVLNGNGGVLIAPVVTSANAGEASNASNGTGEIHTGGAMAWGNTSDTRFVQETDAAVDGMGAVVNTQAGAVANVGLGVANSGINVALGNASNSDAGDGPPAAPGLAQNADIGGGAVTAAGPVTNSNTGSASNDSDGWGYIHTGNTQAQGNVSATAFGQKASGTVGEDGMGVVPNLQVGAVLNLGVGVANSGVNLAVGNASGTGALPLVQPVALTSDNQANLSQDALFNPGNDDIVVVGPLTNFNSGEAGNSSDGTGKVFTGDALATGNVSSSNLNQNVRGNVDGLGVVVGPQLGVIVNAGAGVANSGINASVGNLSSSTAASDQDSTFDPNADITVFGPVTVGNNGSTTNTSDGDACACTGNAVATGNVSSSTLSQDLNIGVDDGLSVVPMNGIILNAGFGLANSGVNLAIGNISQNLATSDQDATLANPAPNPLVGPQTIVNGGGAENASAGTGKVGTGNANATGNLSTSDLVQGVSVDGAGAFALVNGGIANVGAGVANAGVNAGIGNASRNVADLTQNATGSGTVANQGKASNASDGKGGVGDPNCDVPGEGTPGTPGTPGTSTLPKTGGPLEVEAAIALMLLMAGFGFRRFSQEAAKRA